MKHVILGTGPAGVTAAETLRRTDPAADILMIGDEPEPPYSRMAIPYFLTGAIEDGGTHLRKTENHFKALNIKLLRDRAVSLSPTSVRLQSGARASFDRLLIATGSRPAKPPVPGIERPCVHHCWTLADAREISTAATKGANVVLMGAGFIGCIILEALVLRGVNLTVIEQEDRMVPRMMDADAGAMIKRWCEKKGVRVLTSTRVNEITEPTGEGQADVVVSSGEALPADLVVVAAGVRPNVDFLKGSSVVVDRGVVVDGNLQSSAFGVYAAGDVAQGPELFSNNTAVHAIQTTAGQHGRIAALNMAGGNVFYKGSLAMNTLETLGLISTSYGLWQGVEGGGTATAMDKKANRYIRLRFDGDVLVGAIAIGLTDHVGALRGLIESRVRLGSWRSLLMENPYRVVEAYVASTIR